MPRDFPRRASDAVAAPGQVNAPTNPQPNEAALFCLEDKLSPPAEVPSWPRDLFGMGLIAALAAVLWQAWHVPDDQFVTGVAGQMASFYLLPALGFCLALRCGAVDLSVWVAASLGGVVAASYVNAGTDPAWAFAAAAAAGLGLGLINAAAVALARLPSPAVTLVTAMIALGALQAHVDARHAAARPANGPPRTHPDGRVLSAPPGGAYARRRAVAVPPTTFDGWHLVETAAEADAGEADVPADEARQQWYPLSVTRMLIIAVCHGAVMLALLAADAAGRHGARAGARLSRFAALCTSGAVCGLAGACWLIEHNSAPVLSLPVRDLRVPAAALLAGGAFFAGGGRALLAGLALPVAVMLATAWRVEVWVWDLELHGYQLQSLHLAAMVLLAQLAMARLLSRRRHPLLALAAVVLAAGGLLLTAATPAADGYPSRAAVYLAGNAAAAAGAAALVASWALGRKSSRPPSLAGGAPPAGADL
jgi:hypothetical protein